MVCVGIYNYGKMIIIKIIITMAITGIATLKKWFAAGKYPTGMQFASMFDSFFHKDNKIPMQMVDGVAGALNGKWDVSTGNALTTTVNNKLDQWQRVLPEVYFLHANYRWCRVSLIADNGYYADGYQECETFDIDVKALVEQFYSVGNGVYTVMRVLGAYAPDPSANWKIVRYNIVVNAYTMHIQINSPSSHTFTTKIYIQK